MQRLSGEVDRVDRTAIVTRLLLGVVPDVSLVVHTPEGATEPVTVGIPLLRRSIVAAYLSSWSVAFGVVSIGFGIAAAASDDGFELAPYGALAGVAIVAAMRGLRARVGRLPEVEKEIRRVYGAWIGTPVDPALCGTRLDDVVGQLRGYVAARAQRAGAGDYRSQPQTRAACFEAVARSNDVALMGAALTSSGPP